MKKKNIAFAVAIVVSSMYITACSSNTKSVEADIATSNTDTKTETTVAISDDTKADTEAETTVADIAEDTDEAQEGVITSALTTFSTTDLDGNVVDQSIWADYDLTMVNIWATWCGPCVGEMPELAMVYNSINQKANMVSICIDGTDDPDTAKSILKDADAGFITMVSSYTLENQLLKYISAIPTTIFVDSEGRMVGDPIVGARDAEEYKKEIGDRLLN